MEALFTPLFKNALCGLPIAVGYSISDNVQNSALSEKGYRPVHDNEALRF